jgi:hypothetical protein
MQRLFLFLLATSGFALGCEPQGQCSTPGVTLCAVGDTTCTGHLIDANHWESGPFLGTWLTFAPAQTLTLHLRDATTGAPLLGEIVNIVGYVSPNQIPNQGGNQFAPCAGNLCEFNVQPDTTTGGWTVDVINDTCAPYYFYLVVTTAGATDAAVE